MRYKSGNSYEGDWVADKKCGRGVMVWKDVDEMYLGEWENDLPHGYGEHIWAESSAKPSLKRCMCNLYRGEWSNGHRAGVGTFFYSDGSQYTGEWLNNQKDGSGVFCYPEGRLHYGFYAADRMLLTDAKPKETEAVSTQVKLYIGDVLNAACPGDVEYEVSATKTIERLILRYNSTIRQIHKRYVDFGNSKKRQTPVEVLPNEWSRLEKLFYTTRNIHKRVQTSTLGDFWRFCREFSIIGSHFSSYDVCICMQEMQRHRRLVSRDLQREQEDTAARLAKELEQALLAPVIITKSSNKSLKKKNLQKSANALPPPPKKENKNIEKVAVVEVAKTIAPGIYSIALLAVVCL